MCSACAEHARHGRRRQRDLAAVLLVIAVALLTACGDDTSPEARVRARVSTCVDTVESRDLTALRDCLAVDYRDTHHADRRAAVQSVLAYRLRHRVVYLFTHFGPIEASGDASTARSTVYVAMTGVPVESLQALISLQADLYRFDLDWRVEDDDYRITRAEWQRVDDPRRIITGE